MRNHDMKLNEEYFNMVANDIKDIEYRLNDEKRKQIQIGDTITFYKLPLEKEIIKVSVTNLKYYKTLLEMYSATFEKDFKDRYDSPQAVVDDTSYYTNDEVEKNGCVAIYFKKIR